jgi:enoyl-CoA hydratase/carnithine racemase
MILTEMRGKVAVVKMDRGVTNALNLDLVKELSDTFRRLKDDPDVCSLVFTSANEKFFSIGFDIPQLYDLRRDEFEVFYRAFNRLSLDLFRLPKPTVAALAGHAVAGGCVLALCCDYRYIAEGRKLMGLNEVKLGVPVPYPADCILRQSVGDRVAREVMETGDFYPAEQSLIIGMVDRVCPADRLMEDAVEKAESLGRTPAVALAAIKQSRVEGVARRVLERLAEKERLFLDCWFSYDARKRLKVAMERY